MSKSDVDPRDLFILQNMADDPGAGGIGPDRKFADTVTIFISTGIELEIVL
jgi:hypothetical protein